MQNKLIPYGRQEIIDEDIEAVSRVLRSDFLTTGPMVPEFEKMIAEYCHVQHAVSVTNATSALHLGCLSLGVGPGDCVWTSAITFVASANCALYCGATVDFLDIDEETTNVDIDKLREKLAAAKDAAQLPKVIIFVHMAGLSCDMREAYQLSKEYGFRIIEDASHAIGATYEGKPVGCCEYSDLSVFSFHPVKIITTGEGGALTTNDSSIADKVRLLRSHGITRDEASMGATPDGPWYYEQIALGFNYRLTDIQAALGVSQIKRLDAYVQRRNEIAGMYKDSLSDLPLKLPRTFSCRQSSFHLYVIRLDLERSNKNRLDVFESLRKSGVLANLHYIPVYRQPYFNKMGFSRSNFPGAERYYREAISLPMFPSMTYSDFDHVVKVLTKALKA